MSVPTGDLLVGLESIDWSHLSHAYGPADDIPEILRDLQSTDPEVYMTAGDELLSNIYHQGTRYSASVEAVPFLYALLKNKETRSRGFLIDLLLLLAVGNPSSQITSGIDLVKWQTRISEIQEPGYCTRKKQESDEWIAEAADDNERKRRELDAFQSLHTEPRVRNALNEFKTYEAVERGIQSIIDCLDDRSPDIRATAAYCLAFFPRELENITRRLFDLFNREANCAIRGTAVLALAVLHAALDHKPEHASIHGQLQNIYEDNCKTNGADEVTRWSTAMALLILGSKDQRFLDDTSRAVTDELYLASLEASIGADMDFPFAPFHLQDLAQTVLDAARGIQP